MHNKTFSTFNFSFTLSSIVLLILGFINSLGAIRALPLIEGPFAFIALLMFSLAIYIKFPVFVDRDKNSTCNDFELVNSKKVGCLACLYYSLFTAEPSKFMSLFPHSNLIFYKNKHSCKFKWEFTEPKLVHKVLDMIFMAILIFIALVISKILYYWADPHNIYFYIMVYVVALLAIFKKIILGYFLSVKVEEHDGFNINVMYPYSKSKLSMTKQYGQAIPFTKTVSITQDIFNGNPDIKEYIIAHEIGHLRDKKRTLREVILSIVSMAFLVFIPFILSNSGMECLVFFPLIIFWLYSITWGYNFRESSELYADKYAVRLIGKEKCLQALNLMNQYSFSKQKNHNNIYGLFFKVVPIERKIKFINEYSETK